MSLRTSVDLELEPAAAFDAVADELALALERQGMKFQRGAGGSITREGREVARVVRWQPPEEIEFDWLGEAWQPAPAAALRLRFESAGGGTRVTLERPDAASLFGERGQELAGWFAGEAAAPLLQAMTPGRLGDWLTDRRARCPSGAQARAFYRDPLYHRPNFMAILQLLKLTPQDHLLEVGCGGGAFLHDALESGCRAAAVDHSADLLGVARELDAQVLRDKRLELHQADAASLPFAERTFSCAVMTGVFGFLERPLEALREIRRVLKPGGRLVLFTGGKELRGTPAAPEPMASRLRFYEDSELEDLVRQAGFSEVRMEQPDFEALARQAGIPEDFMALFRGRGGGQLLVAK